MNDHPGDLVEAADVSELVLPGEPGEDGRPGFRMVFTNQPPTRRCGQCTLCCRLLPVRALAKVAGQRCTHQRHGKGCTIYAARPSECQLWSCLWLTDSDASGLRRPDRSHYVVDVMPDVLWAHQGDERIELAAVQVWCDPQHPEAWRDPALLEYLEKRAEREGMVALVRYDSAPAIVLFPPAVSGTGRWEEKRDGLNVVKREPAEP